MGPSLAFLKSLDLSTSTVSLQSFAELRSHRNQPGIRQLLIGFCYRGVTYGVGKLIGAAVTG